MLKGCFLVFWWINLFKYGLLWKRLLSIRDVGKCPKGETSNLLLFRQRKMSDYLFSNTLYVAEPWLFIANSQTSVNVWGLVRGAFPTKTGVFFCIYSNVFYPIFSVGSSTAESVFTFFPSWTNGNWCKALIYLKSVLLVFYQPDDLSLLLCTWKFSSSSIAE